MPIMMEKLISVCVSNQDQTQTQNTAKILIKPKLRTVKKQDIIMAPVIKVKAAVKPKATPLVAKAKPVAKVRPSDKTAIKVQVQGSVRVAPKLHEYIQESESEPEDDPVPELYQRWINGTQMLISVDNKYIYDLHSREHVGTVLDESTIEWNNDE